MMKIVDYRVQSLIVQKVLLSCNSEFTIQYFSIILNFKANFTKWTILVIRIFTFSTNLKLRNHLYFTTYIKRKNGFASNIGN